MMVSQIPCPSCRSFGWGGMEAWGIFASLWGRWDGRGLNGEKSRYRLGRVHLGTRCPQGCGDLTQEMPTAAGPAASATRVSPKPRAAPVLK